jgi:pyruvate formate lyase activating enzyme
MTESVLRDLVEAGLDAMNIDIKGDPEMVKKYCGADVEHVWRNAKLAMELGVHIEITMLLIQNFNSKDEIIRKITERIYNDLGELTPLHISRFFPHYKSAQHGLKGPTPTKFLYSAYNIAKEVGLKYVYLGNLHSTEYENTYCPKCSKLVIKRKLLGVQELHLDSNGKCKFCSFPISIF